MNDNDKYVIRAGETAHDQFETDLTIERAGWEFSAIAVLGLEAGQSQTRNSGDTELLVLPFEGGCTVEVNGETFEIKGRESVFTGITDYIYIPRNTEFTVTSKNGGRFCLPAAKATKDLPVRYCPVEEVVTMLRGAGNCSRQVNNYALGNELETSHLLVTEVLTPGGNWSSYPPHKHDEHNENERVLEEIYYYEVREGNGGKNGKEGFALQRIYPSPGKPIDVCTEVRSRDIVIMPYGYHGPSVAAPGYDLYYLNVMAGPAEDSTWLMTNDPHHDWVRENWSDQAIDPRLPMTPMND
ncbi:5-deoxy-glucuronate isomerase [Gleimia hominis]|uniref:5-deoxy-glucuronate isomerase n=1 Tax=Gleimia hominis TaxID=595468 RepID=UPI000C807CBE|nr:5-deoxy-glucuronate isomerase [Gleimia hominis]WIK64140.1 5-deoxy-glucuronate isomerase [Gleimia hominis]